MRHAHSSAGRIVPVLPSGVSGGAAIRVSRRTRSAISRPRRRANSWSNSSSPGWGSFGLGNGGSFTSCLSISRKRVIRASIFVGGNLIRRCEWNPALLPRSGFPFVITSPSSSSRWHARCRGCSRTTVPSPVSGSWHPSRSRSRFPRRHTRPTRIPLLPQGSAERVVVHAPHPPGPRQTPCSEDIGGNSRPGCRRHTPPDRTRISLRRTSDSS